MTIIDSSRWSWFFVVGAQKAGTTTLHTWLSREAEVCLPKIKETHFFRDEEKFGRGAAAYLAEFKPEQGRQVFGEVDPEYLFFPEVPRRIRSVVANPRIVCVLRDPLKRAFSHYRMSVRRGFEDLGFVEALDAEEGRLAEGDRSAWIHHSYLSRGRYAEQIQRYREVFGPENLHVVRFEDLFSETSGAQTYAGIRRFIGLTGEVAAAPPARVANAASESRFDWLTRWIYVRSPARARIGKLIPSRKIKRRMALFADRLNRKPAAPLPEDWMDAVPDRLRQRINREILELQDLTRMDLEPWVLPAA